MTSLALIPLLCVVVLGVGHVLVATKRQTLAQAICIHRGSALADELGRHLGDLLKLNRTARTLRRSQQLATAALRVATAAGNVPAATAARAVLNGIRIAQKVLDVRQHAIRLEADFARLRHRGKLKTDVQPLHARRVRFDFARPRALAVRASPPRAIAPEYEPAPDFARAQAQTVSFEVDLAPNLPRALDWPKVKAQPTACVITLQKETNTWRPKIVAASARSSWPSWPWL